MERQLQEVQKPEVVREIKIKCSQCGTLFPHTLSKCPKCFPDGKVFSDEIQKHMRFAQVICDKLTPVPKVEAMLCTNEEGRPALRLTDLRKKKNSRTIVISERSQALLDTIIDKLENEYPLILKLANHSVSVVQLLLDDSYKNSVYDQFRDKVLVQPKWKRYGAGIASLLMSAGVLIWKIATAQ